MYGYSQSSCNSIFFLLQSEQMQLIIRERIFAEQGKDSRATFFKQFDRLLVRSLRYDFSVCDIATAHIAKHSQKGGPSFRKVVLIVRPIDQHVDWVMESQVHEGLYRSLNSEFDLELVELDSFVL